MCHHWEEVLVWDEAGDETEAIGEPELGDANLDATPDLEPEVDPETVPDADLNTSRSGD